MDWVRLVDHIIAALGERVGLSWRSLEPGFPGGSIGDGKLRASSSISGLCGYTDDFPHCTDVPSLIVSMGEGGSLRFPDDHPWWRRVQKWLWLSGEPKAVLLESCLEGAKRVEF